MSSPRLSVITKTTVFQLVLYASAGFVVLALLILWGLGWLSIQQIDAREQARIDGVLAAATEIYEEQGRAALIAEIQAEEDRIWEEDFIFEILEQEEDLIVLRNEEFDPLAGYPGLHTDEEFTFVLLDHPEIDELVRAELIEFDTGDTLTVGRFVPQDRYEVWSFMIFASIALVVIVMPLSLLTGYFLSRNVVRRLQTISQTAEEVGQGKLIARAPLNGSGDEFDRLSMGLNTMLDRLQVLNRNIEAVSIGVAHDLKTPIANVQGRLELMRRDLSNPALLEEHIGVAETRIGQLLRTFEALLRLGEVEAGKRKEAFDAFDLSSAAQEIVENYEAVFEDGDKFLTSQIDPCLMIQGDRELVDQLMANLLENALEHARDAAQVFLRLTSDGERAVLTIGDDGPGIPPPMRARIFERFVRGDASRTTPGNGLGLSLVKAIAELHGTEVQLLEDQKGAVFQISFSKIKALP